MSIFDLLSYADAFFWGYVGFVLILTLGCYLTFRTRFYQFWAFPHIVRTFVQFLFHRSSEDRGIHPLKAFFASVGGMIGVGNVVGIVTAVQLGGPGALLWVWVAGFAGTLIKYSEIYLGLKYRVDNNRQGYDGGPMFFLQKAFNVRWISTVICVLLCIYAAEIYQFNVVVDSLSQSWGAPRLGIAILLLAMILYATWGGVSRVGKVCSWMMPIFLFVYLAMCIWVIGDHILELPQVLMTVLHSAFTGHAAIGGFAGSTMMLAVQNGMAGASYAADIGIGYDSTIQSESHTVYPERQARMAFLGVCLNNIICTLSIMLVLVTGTWEAPIGDIPPVQIALASYFPILDQIMPIFIFLLGYTTLIAYLIVGVKCARYLHPRLGAGAYIAYSIVVLIFFSFFDQTKALLVMRIAGALLLIINLTGIYRLRREVVFGLDEEDKEEELALNLSSNSTAP